jgi:hypothetical protein
MWFVSTALIKNGITNFSHFSCIPRVMDMCNGIDSLRAECSEVPSIGKGRWRMVVWEWWWRLGVEWCSPFQSKNGTFAANISLVSIRLTRLVFTASREQICYQTNSPHRFGMCGRWRWWWCNWSAVALRLLHFSGSKASIVMCQLWTEWNQKWSRRNRLHTRMCMKWEIWGRHTTSSSGPWLQGSMAGRQPRWLRGVWQICQRSLEGTGMPQSLHNVWFFQHRREGGLCPWHQQWTKWCRMQC